MTTFDEATLLDDCFSISKKVLFSPCTSVHKHEQKGRTTTLVKFPTIFRLPMALLGAQRKIVFGI